MTFESRELLEAQCAIRQPRPGEEDLDMELTKLIDRMEDDEVCRRQITAIKSRERGHNEHYGCVDR